MTRVLIVGIGGQDGVYLARHLVDLGDQVWGTSRAVGTPSNLVRLDVADCVTLRRCDLQTASALATVVEAAQPEEIYYLAAQSSVSQSFVSPSGAMSATVGFAHLLEVTRGSSVRILEASSIDCFGEAPADRPITEETAFAPRSPYATAKIAQSTLARLARDEAGGRFVATAYLGNHESPLRDGRFVTRKIVDAARRIAEGSTEILELGDVAVIRDWGWAPDYVAAMRAILQHDRPDSFVIATGRSEPLSYFVSRVFATFGLDWQLYVRANVFPARPLEVRTQHVDPTKAAAELNWRAAHDIDAVAELLGVKSAD
ncbi:MAG: GDP-mannose 4,6-dehydratase [Sphingomonas sp.]|uniref:GDP-mannose 4,6-dehydratase n=1 Tax=Sphingomonas sp. TaxID=28214 RepID=UPI001AD1ACBF|nr:GDP-mannose 4,6-dehydratase [Sphingomonas sp.]MBN8806900.1 GDP-mannose 4,6-dehydratase [Sphingomonas sp.]